MTDWTDPARWHPAAQIFPLVSDAELAILAKDIAAQGLQNPLVIHEGLLLDGRNRARACALVDVKPWAIDWDGGDRDPVAWVISQNLERRHLNESQRALCAARFATLRHGQKKADGPIGLSSQPEAAERFHVGLTQVKRGRVLLDDGVLELVALVNHGLAAVSLAAALAAEPKPYQRKVVARVDADTPLREAWRQVRAETRVDRPLPDGAFRVLYADPPWAYRDERGGLDDYVSTAASHHYPTMPTDEIAALQIEAMAAPDAVLFLWATCPLLEDALEVMAAWGFAYKTLFVWQKPRGSFGHYHKADAELLLLGTRGSATPDVDTRVSQVLTGPTAEHSRKPDSARDLIDTLYTHGPRIELFARRPASATWAVWGNEA